MNQQEEKRLGIIENTSPEILGENIPREIYISDVKFLIKLIRQLENEMNDWQEYE